MRSFDRAARAERRLLRQLSKHLGAASGFGDPRRPPPHLPKDFLGAAVTVAILGAILLEVTNGLVSQCALERSSRSGRGTCSGLAVVAHHAHGAVTACVAACGALAVIAFIWYMLGGYKTGQMSGNQDTSGG